MKNSRYLTARPLFEYEPYSTVVVRSLEEEIWAAIRPLSVLSICEEVLSERTGRSSRRFLQETALRIVACIRQADQFFWIALEADSRAAPLLHYYSMLNLSKALVYLDSPETFTANSQLLHGISDPDRVKNPRTYSLLRESLRLQSNGVFPCVYALLTGESFKAKSVRLADLLPLCTWIGEELPNVYGVESNLACIDLTVYDDRDSEENSESRAMYARAEIPKADVRGPGGRVRPLQKIVPAFFDLFEPVASANSEILTFETKRIQYRTEREENAALASILGIIRELRLCRLFSSSATKAGYMIPLVSDPLPEPCIVLAVMFYLGSLVRYQPHVYEHLLGTDTAYVLDSFVRQTPIVFAYIMLNHLWRVEHFFSPLGTNVHAEENNGRESDDE